MSEAVDLGAFGRGCSECCFLRGPEGAACDTSCPGWKAGASGLIRDLPSPSTEEASEEGSAVNWPPNCLPPGPTRPFKTKLGPPLPLPLPPPRPRLPPRVAGRVSSDVVVAASPATSEGSNTVSLRILLPPLD